MNFQFPPDLLVGTSSWSSPDWGGTFYPDSTEPGEMIRVYANKLPTVEIDGSWNAGLWPACGWNARMPFSCRCRFT
jgi:uncharacterized protein YecE (DUF72 family)